MCGSWYGRRRGYFDFGWLRLGPIPVKNALGWYGLVDSQRGVLGRGPLKAETGVQFP